MAFWSKKGPVAPQPIPQAESHSFDITDSADDGHPHRSSLIGPTLEAAGLTLIVHGPGGLAELLPFFSETYPQVVNGAVPSGPFLEADFGDLRLNVAFFHGPSGSAATVSEVTLSGEANIDRLFAITNDARLDHVRWQMTIANRGMTSDEAAAKRILSGRVLTGDRRFPALVRALASAGWEIVNEDLPMVGSNIQVGATREHVVFCGAVEGNLLIQASFARAERTQAGHQHLERLLAKHGHPPWGAKPDLEADRAGFVVAVPFWDPHIDDSLAYKIASDLADYCDAFEADLFGGDLL